MDKNVQVALRKIGGYWGKLKTRAYVHGRLSKKRFTNDERTQNKCFFSLLHSFVANKCAFKLAAMVFNNPITREESIVYTV